MKYEMIAPDDNKSEIIEENDYKTYVEKGYEHKRSIPETVADEDELAGHYFPGHELWED